MKNLFNKIKSFVQNLFTSVFDKFRIHSELAVMITQNLKNAVRHPFLGIGISIIPGKVGVLLVPLLPKAIEVTEKIALKVAIYHDILSEYDNNGDVVMEIVLRLRKSAPSIGIMFWQDFGTELIIALSDGNISWKEANDLREKVYQELKSKNIL